MTRIYATVSSERATYVLAALERAGREPLTIDTTGEEIDDSDPTRPMSFSDEVAAALAESAAT